jgi:hypothetical protein
MVQTICHSIPFDQYSSKYLASAQKTIKLKSARLKLKEMEILLGKIMSSPPFLDRRWMR